MSGFIGAAQPRFNHGEQDLRLAPPMMRLRGALFGECISAIAPPSFQSEWWPGGGFMGDAGADVGMLFEDGLMWEPFQPAAGASMRYGFTGITRDQWGTAVGSCNVLLFRTSDNLLLDSTTSNAMTGEFLLSTAYYPDAHYIVAHKTGSPDIDGASVNTLIGS